ncbi:hypothetical protein GCM10029976_032650 [Kribbella albertanoniae]
MHPDDSRPLSPGQERKWEEILGLSGADPGVARAQIIACRRVRGLLDIGVLRAAADELTQRHEPLRLTFTAVGTDPRIRIAPELDPPIDVVDLSSLPGPAQDRRLGELMHREQTRYFDFRRGPLWQLVVARLGPDEHLLIACFATVISDGWAVALFISELLRECGVRAGLLPPVRPTVPTFEQIAAGQTDNLAVDPARLSYWREHLTDMPRSPLLQATSTSSTDPDSRQAILFSVPEGHGVQRLAWSARTTPFVCLLAAHHLLILLVTGRSDAVVSTSDSGRRARWQKYALMSFEEEHYIAAAVSPRDRLVDVVQAVHRTISSALSSPLPYSELAAAVYPRYSIERPWPDHQLRESDISSWAPSVPEPDMPGFVIEDVDVPPLRPAGVAPTAFPSADPVIRRAWENKGAPWFVVNLNRDGGAVVYNDQLHSPPTVQALTDQYLWVVSELVRHPETTVDQLRLRFHRQRLTGAGSTRPAR